MAVDMLRASEQEKAPGGVAASSSLGMVSSTANTTSSSSAVPVSAINALEYNAEQEALQRFGIHNTTNDDKKRKFSENQQYSEEGEQDGHVAVRAKRDDDEIDI